MGAYRDEQERPYVFSSVTKAERLLLEAGNNKEYLPVTGLPAFTVRLVLRRSRLCSNKRNCIVSTTAISAAGSRGSTVVWRGQ